MQDFKKWRVHVVATNAEAYWILLALPLEWIEFVHTKAFVVCSPSPLVQNPSELAR